MSKRENVIEINGKRYDAYSGALMSASGQSAAPAEPVRQAAQRSMDGFSPYAAPKARSMDMVAQPPKVSDINRPNPQHIRHHAPKRSETLVRHAVNKPEAGSLKRHHKASSHTHALVAQPEVAVTKKLSHPQVDVNRQTRANRVPQSEFVRRYSEGTSTPQPRPVESAAIKPVHASTAAQHSVSLPSAASMDVFERALQQANSHLQPVHHSNKEKSKWGKRALRFSAASLGVLLIAGFVAIQNQANLKIKYAAGQAGIAASLPSYSPTGFAVGKFTYSPGNVAVAYNNASSGQAFELQQKESAWDSTALKENFVSVADSNFKSVQAAGRTVYTYGNGSATWVNDGIWYNVISNGSLTTNELVDLAKSM